MMTVRLLLLLLTTLSTNLHSQGPLPVKQVHAQVPLTLEEARERAATNALDVLTARQQLESAELDVAILDARLRPSLDLVANFPNYYKTSREVILDDGTVGFRDIELNNSFVGLLAQQRIAATGATINLESRLQRTDNLAQDATSYQGSPIRLSVRQPLLAFNPLKWDRELVPLRRDVRRAEWTAARADATLDATDRFFDLVSADQERRIAEVNRTANEQLYAVAEERYELGKINRGDLLQLRLELRSAEQNLLRAERLVATASTALRQLLGEPYTGIDYVPVLPTTTELPDVPDAATALDRLRRYRPELLAAELRRREADRERDRVRRDFGPRIDIEAGYGFIRNDDALSPIYNDPREERILSVNLALPLVDWGERRARVQQATTSQELAREVARRTELDLTSELTQLLDQWGMVGEELRLAEAMMELANERFAISRESYELGAIPLTELSLAQEFRDRTTRAYTGTLRTYWQTYARLSALTLLTTND